MFAWFWIEDSYVGPGNMATGAVAKSLKIPFRFLLTPCLHFFRTITFMVRCARKKRVCGLALYPFSHPEIVESVKQIELSGAGPLPFAILVRKWGVVS